MENKSEPLGDPLHLQKDHELLQPSISKIAARTSSENLKVFTVDSDAVDQFTKESAEKLCKEGISPELSEAIYQSVQILDKTHHQMTVYDTQFTVKEGVYLRMSIYKGEPALGDQVMKTDHWEGIHQLVDHPPLEGAPNFRQIDGTVLFGVGQPNIVALKKVIEKLLNELSFKSVVWINFREEPVCYLDGTSYAPRDPETLNINLEHLIGIDGLDLEDMEQRLKADIKRRVYENGEGAFSYYYQTKSMANEIQSVVLTASRIQTPREVFNFLIQQHKFPVEYYRIPITDECAPEIADLDELVAVIKSCGSDTAIVANCQMGRGRTTTGLVCSYLILYTHGSQRDQSFFQSRRKGGKKCQLNWDAKNPNYANGEYEVIRRLCEVLENGESIKRQVDEAIDKCKQFQNLRVAIQECKDLAEKGTDVMKNYKRGLNYLERYWWLIVFNAYLCEESPLYKKKFASWMKGRWGLRRMLKKLELK